MQIQYMICDDNGRSSSLFGSFLRLYVRLSSLQDYPEIESGTKINANVLHGFRDLTISQRFKENWDKS